MTYIRKALDEICINFCPICDECERSHLCINIREIRNRIMDIMAESNDN